ncbi:efflux RND transporter permease subunit [Sphingomonas prati]|uniref:Multidrug efflux pump n=1 Tax=Sphingomonas prati TaxID=1843237 RepID=A0A7W9BQ50_9SPHN|nr:efflux RND transporter permease subunit [Sphingomonas prati]MBB5728136.1 multidrug efflux pump [Sphingomonas prati]GGE83543.1 multidrug transporter [Sphingomonas prati]
MMLSDVSVRRPIFAAVLAILLTVVGVVAFFALSVREYPDVDPPIVSVQTTYTGAAANVVESRVTQLLEERLAGIAGIQTITSVSRDGASNISVEFAPGSDVDSAANDVRDRVGGAAEDLPDGTLPPEVRKVDADAQPVIWFALSAPPGWTRIQLSDWADRNLVDRFSAIPGVAQVQVGGEARPAMRVWLDPAKLGAFALTPGDVETAMRTQNVELPAGRIEAQSQNVTVRVNRSFATPEQFARLIVARGAGGYLVRLGDVARVELGPENPYSAFRSNGKTGVGLGIVRQSGANTLAVAEAAKAVAAAATPGLPAGMRIDVASDSSLFIDRAIEGVYHTLAEAAVLVVLVIFLFLGSWRATLIPAVTVPICLLGTFAVLWAGGFSINLLTLLALVLAIGLVVDDAIVVLENVYHRIEQGEDPLVASYLGTRQVGFAVISTTLVVCAVFVPIMFLSGQTGLLFRELAVAMVGAVAFSGFLALSLAPMLCSKLLRNEERGRFAHWIDARFQRIERGYDRSLARAFAKPWIVLGVTAGVLVLAGVLYTTLNSELAPAEDVGVIQVQLSTAEGTGFAELDRQMKRVEQKILPLVGEGPVRGALTRLPGGGADEDFNTGRMVVFLKPWEERTETTQQVIEAINAKVREMPAMRGNAASPSSLGRGRGQPINFVIAGASYAELARARDRILAAAAQNPGLVNLDSDYKETKPQLLIDVDTERAGALGVSVDAVSQALQTLMGSRRVSTFVDRGEEYRVIVQAEADGRSVERDLQQVYVRSASGQLVPLANLVRTRQGADARELGRYNKARAITLQGALAPGYTLGSALTFLEKEAAGSPEISAIGYRGESQAFRETGNSILLVFALTIVVVYLLLAAQFESFVHPAVIITTVPLAVAGGIIGLAAMGETLNLYSQVGIVMLVGLAAKNGILIVEFANQLRDEGVAFGDAIAQAAARRLRPILMTSIATVAGAVPLMLASGAGAAARRSIGVVVVWGVSIATLVTIFLIPLLYLLVARRTDSPQAVSRRLDAQLQGGPSGAVEHPAE